MNKGIHLLLILWTSLYLATVFASEWSDFYDVCMDNVFQEYEGCVQDRSAEARECNDILDDGRVNCRAVADADLEAREEAIEENR